MKGYAPGWVMRCGGCGRSAPAADYGLIRVGAWSRGERLGAWCRVCRRLRMLHVEKVPQAKTA
ncbi:MAG: hypothetical protein H0V36_04955 [Chloroflexi bacterium]|nr:hypothetical protein [Chloroflexota bacterium]